MCKNSLPHFWVFLNFLGSQFMVFANDWPIPAILVIPDDHEGYGVRSSENVILSFSYRKGGQGAWKRSVFAIFWLIQAKIIRKIRYHVNYNEKLNIFQKLPSRIYDPRFSKKKKKHTFFIFQFFIEATYYDFQLISISFSRSITSGGHLRLIIAKMTRSTPKVISENLFP